jgi:hypothetical protein
MRLGPLLLCVTNTLVDTRHDRRFAQAARNLCGSLEQRRDLATCPTFILLNAELVACRTSTPRTLRQHERDHNAQSGPARRSRAGLQMAESGGSISDMLNLSRAKDAAISIALSGVNALDRRDAPPNETDRQHPQAAGPATQIATLPRCDFRRQAQPSACQLTILIRLSKLLPTPMASHSPPSGFAKDARRGHRQACARSTLWLRFGNAIICPRWPRPRCSQWQLPHWEVDGLQATACVRR